jgi:hypothetical protein
MPFTKQDVAAIEKELLPAKLADIPENGEAISMYVIAHKLPETIDGVRIAIKALTHSLVWDVAPKAAKPIPQQGKRDDRKDTERASAIKEANEKILAQKKVDEENFKTAAEVIAHYLPIDNRGRIEHAKQERNQAALRAMVEKAKQEKYSSADVLAAVRREVAKMYEVDEKARVNL